MKLNIHPQFKNPKFYFIILGDTFLFALSLYLSFLFRFEFAPGPLWMKQMFGLLVWVVPLKLIFFLFSGLYRGMWRYTGMHDFWLLARTSFLSTMVIIFVILYSYRFENYSRAVFIMDGFLTFLLTGGLRIMVRSYYTFRNTAPDDHHVADSGKLKKILIVGAGDAGEKILREIMDNQRLHYKVMGFIDDDPRKRGRSIHGVLVRGNLKKLASILEKEDIDEILIADPSAGGEQIRDIVEICKSHDVSYKRLPRMGELIDGRVSVKVLRDISYEDLLGRPPVKLDDRGIRSCIKDKTVLVTGCGGSIGSELCRQIVRYQPGCLLLLDAGEANLFHIQMELQNESNFNQHKAILGQVQDKNLMEDIFQKYRPRIVFHAAAYKHVPMLEANPWEAVFNNIIGTRMAMEMAVQYGVERFVLISTDKAVHPVNVMGASKRVTELLMQSLQDQGTRLMAVRFGNVIGSSGSVIPVFRRQIERGGPVTVTHPEVTRYFMTIPEAAQLVLQAAGMGQGGEIFVLKMGTPVRIADMARDLIRLSGKNPDTDVQIVYTGLRAGEKLYEELITEGEGILPTPHEKILVLRVDESVEGFRHLERLKQKLDKDIAELVKYSLSHDVVAIKKKLQEMVSEYNPQESEPVL